MWRLAGQPEIQSQNLIVRECSSQVGTEERPDRLREKFTRLNLPATLKDVDTKCQSVREIKIGKESFQKILAMFSSAH